MPDWDVFLVALIDAFLFGIGCAPLDALQMPDWDLFLVALIDAFLFGIGCAPLDAL